MSDSDEEETMAIAHLQSIRQRRRPPHSKRRASRDSAAKGKMNSTWDDQKKEERVMILKQAAAKMGVKQMSSTAYLSESEEEAMIMAQEQSVRFLKEVTDEIEGSRLRKPPHLVRRDSRLLPQMMWYKPQNILFMDKEESELAHQEFFLFLDSLMKAKEETIVLQQQPSQGLKIQN